MSVPTSVRTALRGPGYGAFEVALVSGQTATVQTELEQQWFNQTRDAYLNETKLTEVTDLRDLDRVLVMELLIFRWTQHLASGTDYEDDMVDENTLRRQVRETSDQLNKVKTAMGLTKQARDAAVAEGNFGAWLTDLKARAKAFGIHRENQLRKALSLFNELSAVIGIYRRSDEEERRKAGFETAEDILQWLEDVALPEYRRIDEHFRANAQRMWIRDM